MEVQALQQVSNHSPMTSGGAHPRRMTSGGVHPRRGKPGGSLWIAGIMGLVLLGLPAGCVETKSFLNFSDCPPRGPVNHIAVTWKSEVMSSPDPTRNGAPNPVLASRLYLLGCKEFPMECEGSVVVECYNDTPGVEPTALERWELDKDTMKRLARKDIIGWGYTLLLPWGSCKPEITQVKMKTCYQPTKGSPLFTENVVTINGLQDFQMGVRTTQGGNTPAAAAPAVTPPAAPAAAAQPQQPARPPMVMPAALMVPQAPGQQQPLNLRK